MSRNPNYRISRLAVDVVSFNSVWNSVAPSLRSLNPGSCSGLQSSPAVLLAENSSYRNQLGTCSDWRSPKCLIPALNSCRCSWRLGFQELFVRSEASQAWLVRVAAAGQLVFCEISELGRWTTLRYVCDFCNGITMVLYHWYQQLDRWRILTVWNCWSSSMQKFWDLFVWCCGAASCLAMEELPRDGWCHHHQRELCGS
jgi:hypothetical protein